MSDDKEIIKEAYLEWVKRYCNNDFKDGIPKVIELVIEKMIEDDKISTEIVQNRGIKSKSIDGMSVTYRDDVVISRGEEGLRPDIKALLAPYVIRKARFI